MSTTASPRQWQRLVYGAYAWAVFVPIVVALLAVLAVTPSTAGCRRAARWAARLFFACIGSPVRVSGASLPRGGPCVVAANHASYLDGIILTAALPPVFTFVIKHEMAKVPIASFLLRRLGSEFVDRGNGQHRNRVARRLLTAARAGDSLAFFPEGTFDPSPGLKRFQLGAFAAAWSGRMPLVPVVISGSRRKLEGGRWLPAPGGLSVHVGQPIDPSAQGSARSLMEAARKAILARLDEPDLDGDTEADLTEAPVPLAGDP